MKREGEVGEMDLKDPETAGTFTLGPRRRPGKADEDAEGGREPPECLSPRLNDRSLPLGRPRARLFKALQEEALRAGRCRAPDPSWSPARSAGALQALPRGRVGGRLVPPDVAGMAPPPGPRRGSVVGGGVAACPSNPPWTAAL